MALNKKLNTKKKRFIDLNKTFKVNTCSVINVLKNHYRSLLVSKPNMELYNAILNVLSDTIFLNRPNRNFPHEKLGPSTRKYKKK